MLWVKQLTQINCRVGNEYQIAISAIYALEYDSEYLTYNVLHIVGVQHVISWFCK